MIEETATATRDYTGVTTEQIVIEALTENTGRAICDSGGAYGRHWQRNATRDFAEEPATRARWSTWRAQDKGILDGRLEPSVSVSLYHWMVSNLEFDSEMQAQLDEWAAQHEEDNWLLTQEDFADYIHDRDGYAAPPKVFNTYNDPDNIDLDQVIQYVALYAEDSYFLSHLIISVHGGCDVRGGYASPKCFRVKADEGELWGSAAVREISADLFYWSYNDGCWTGAPDTNCTQVPDLFDIPALTFDDLCEFDEGDAVGPLDGLMVELRNALREHKRQVDALGTTTLSDEARAQAKAAMLSNSKELEEELMLAASGYLDTPIVVVNEGKAYLVFDEQVMQLSAGNCYL